MSDIPEGANASVAKIAIAWEIAKMSIPSGQRGAGDETLKKMIDAYLRAFKAIKDEEPIAGD